MDEHSHFHLMPGNLLRCRDAPGYLFSAVRGCKECIHANNISDHVFHATLLFPRFQCAHGIQGVNQSDTAGGISGQCEAFDQDIVKIEFHERFFDQ